jgi:hypothetical protein
MACLLALTGRRRVSSTLRARRVPAERTRVAHAPVETASSRPRRLAPRKHHGLHMCGVSSAATPSASCQRAARCRQTELVVQSNTPNTATRRRPCRAPTLDASTRPAVPGRAPAPLLRSPCRLRVMLRSLPLRPWTTCLCWRRLAAAGEVGTACSARHSERFRCRAVRPRAARWPQPNT